MGQSVKMMEIAHKASKKYKDDILALKQQRGVEKTRALESQVMNIVTKKHRAVIEPDTRAVVHAASSKKQKLNPFMFDAKKTSSSMSSVRDSNPDLFNALRGFGSGSLRDKMGAIANISRI